MAIGGAFLGGGVELVPAGSCKLELEILTEDRANLTATFTIKGTSTYTVTAGADGRAVYTVPAGQTYTVSVNTTGYDNLASQTVIAESGTVRYVRFEAFSGRVKRSGDTMTGDLVVSNAYIRTTRSYPRIYLKDTSGVIGTTNGGDSRITFQDKNDAEIGSINNQIGKLDNIDGATYTHMQAISKKSDGTLVYATMAIRSLPNGTTYGVAPTPSSKTDNSTKIATTAWVNQSDFLVHTTGNEEIAGIKSFLDPVYVSNNLVTIDQSQDSTAWTYVRGIEFRVANDQRFGEMRTCRYTNAEGSLVNSTEIITTGKDKIDTLLAVVSADNGKKYAIAPTTPSDATSNEIATADWSLDKFQRKITYGTGDPPSGGQAGDIYIKI